MQYYDAEDFRDKILRRNGETGAECVRNWVEASVPTATFLPSHLDEAPITAV